MNQNILQAVFLNRFTPATSSLPFAVDTVSVLFPETSSTGETGLLEGSTFEVLVYLDATGSGRPENARLVVRQSVGIHPSDTLFQDVVLAAPLTVLGGDVWVGFTNAVTAVDRRPIEPGVVDTSSESAGPPG